MDEAKTPPARVRLMGAEVDLVTPTDVLAFAAARVAAGEKGLVANHNAHSLALLRRDPAMRAFYQRADIVEIDSTPLIAWGRLLGLPLTARHRCTYLDWREAFWAMARERGWRVFYLGGAPGVAEKAAANIGARWPGVAIGVHHGYFDRGGSENLAVVGAINDFAPDVIFVGMGMPDQERWIAANLDRLARGVVFSVGGAFDYEAGAQTTPPRWTGKVGLEWLFRFAADPRRLFARYFLEPWRLIPLALADLRGAR